jgi:hypothetical protein
VKAVDGLVGVCKDVVVPLVLRSFAWEDAGDDFECHYDYNVEAGSFSYTPEAAPVGTTPSECAWQVRHTCTSTFSLAVTSRSHYRESSQGRSGSRDSVHYEHNLVEAASSVDVDDSLVVSEAQVPVAANFDEALDDVEVAQAAEASQGAESNWSAVQADSLYFESMEVEDLPLVDPMVIDPWWWQGVVTFEYTPRQWMWMLL